MCPEQMEKETGRLSDYQADKGDDLDEERGDNEDITDDKTGIETENTGRKKDKEKPKHQRKLHGSHRGLKEGKQKEEDMITSGSYTPTKEDRDEDKKTLRNMRMYGKSNDIITDMNIMKLDLMKTQNKFQEVSTEARVGDTKHLKDVRHPEGLTIREATTIDQRTGNTAPLERGDKKSVPKGNKAPKDLGKSADETIFKTISLKLDLTKTLK